MIQMRIKLCALATILLVSFPAYARDAAKGLARDEAQRRKAMIGDRLSYDLSIALEATKPDFSGTATIRFDLKQKGDDLTVDFDGGKIETVVVNGAKQANPKYNGSFLAISSDALNIGTNTIEIAYSHHYNNDGTGLHRFKDPEDGNVYLYTHFEPYDANQLFPCFDQPDLKATYKLTATVPKDWVVVSSAKEKQVDKSGDKAIWNFPPTEKVSTYLFSLHAGPYVTWSSRAGDVPLRLLSRKTQAKYVEAYVQPKNWFKVTRRGFAYFQKYFDRRYPFGKYDQILVPDYNGGAMENIGAVTFNENFIPRTKATQNQWERTSNVILHEMAHMWFGDLVTMQWWDALWLNESFATYLASLAMHDGAGFKKEWQTFYGRIKQFAYEDDQLVTTHPVDTEVRDTQQAFVNFDGITYGKGASALKQLAFYIGPDAFRDGVRDYLQKHAFNNATLDDFFSAIEKSSKKDLADWNNLWLRTAGLNTVEAKYTCEAGKIKSFVLLQSAPSDHPELRPHRTKIALYNAQASTLKLSSTTEVEYAKAETEVAQLLGRRCPDFVYPNHEDYDYVKVALDPRSIQTAQRLVGTIGDGLARTMVWIGLWDRVLDAQWPVTGFADLLATELGKDRDDKVVQLVLNNTEQRVRGYLPLLDDEPQSKMGQAVMKKVENAFWTALMRSAPSSDLQKIWFDAFVRSAHSPEKLAALKKLLIGKLSISGFTFDQDRRWETLVQLNVHNVDGAAGLVDKEIKLDPSDRGAKMAVLCEAARPDRAIKRKWIDEMLDDNSKLPLAKLRMAMGGVFPRNQSKARAEFASEYFSKLPTLAKKRPNMYLRGFTRSMAPALCTQESVENLARFLDKHRDLPPVVTKSLKATHQEDERCTKIRLILRTSTEAL